MAFLNRPIDHGVEQGFWRCFADGLGYLWCKPGSHDG